MAAWGALVGLNYGQYADWSPGEPTVSNKLSWSIDNYGIGQNLYKVYETLK